MAYPSTCPIANPNGYAPFKNCLIDTEARQIPTGSANTTISLQRPEVGIKVSPRVVRFGQKFTINGLSGLEKSPSFSLNVLIGAEVAAQRAVQILEGVEAVTPIIGTLELAHLGSELWERQGFIATFLDALDLNAIPATGPGSAAGSGRSCTSRSRLSATAAPSRSRRTRSRSRMTPTPGSRPSTTLEGLS